MLVQPPTRGTFPFRHFVLPLAGLAGIFFPVMLILRLALWVTMARQIEFLQGLEALASGLFYDCATFVFFALPWVLYLSFTPNRLGSGRLHRAMLWGLAIFSIALLLFVAVSEWFFWDEFGVRFNFIAVDYLVYTTEVIGNIRQSYPLVPIFGALALVTLLIAWPMRKFWRGSGERVAIGWRLAVFNGWLVLAVFDHLLISDASFGIAGNSYADQIGRNGFYQFFAAYRNAELDYQSFYLQASAASRDQQLRELVKTPEATFVGPNGIERTIAHAGVEEHRNIVLISVESLSGDFMAAFGNTEGLTPNLDRLADESLFFTQLYATGNRTIRGLEALSIGVPPSPGEAIVKRPHNEGLFGLGSVLTDKGYQPIYLYGGYSYFDNMRDYFEGLGYKVIDRLALAKEEIHHETIWGVADEDLFTLSLKTFDQAQQAGKPFFGHIMTVSNHRPYTYPEGRIDIPSKSGRAGAVKYTDYAIGDFIERARSKPWFANTIFVIVADHCASSAGRVDLPIERYHIPLMIYAPGRIQPAHFDRLMSQIDIAPTLLGLLNMSYRSSFFGYDMFQLEAGRERAFIATYQQLGYLRDGILTILKPKRESAQQIPDATGESAAPLPAARPDLLEQAIVLYQSSSEQFKSGALRNARLSSLSGSVPRVAQVRLDP